MRKRRLRVINKSRRIIIGFEDYFGLSVVALIIALIILILMGRFQEATLLIALLSGLGLSEVLKRFSRI